MPRASDPNRCRAEEIEPIGLAANRSRRGAPPSPPAAQIRRSRPPLSDDEEDVEEEAQETRLHSDEAKKNS